MTENVFGRLKQRFPVLRELRTNLRYSQRIIVVCCILHNFAVLLGDELPHDVNASDPHRRPLPGSEDVALMPTNAQRQWNRRTQLFTAIEIISDDD